MFLDNKYTRIYFLIIDRARERLITEYVEKHHIIPKCLNGTNDKENIIRLTAREHFIVHRLLIRMVKLPLHRQKMGLALSMFRTECKNHPGRKLTSHDYEIIRIEVSKACKGRKPSDACFDALSIKLKGVPLKDEHKNKLSDALRKIITCKIIGPDDVIYNVPDLKLFCKEHNLSEHYMTDLWKNQNDTRIYCGKRKGWGLYLGTITEIPDRSEVNSKRASKGWEKEKKNTTEINRNTKYLWILQDPDGNIHETFSLGKFTKALGRGSDVIQSREYNVPINVGVWKGWIKLERIKI